MKQVQLTASDIDQHLYIVDKQDALIPYRPNRIQRDLESKLTGRDLVLKYRQGGVSTYFVAKNFKRAITQRARIGIMAHDDETTQKLRRMAQVFWENLPNDLRPIRGLDNAKTTTYKNTGSEITIATAGNTKVGRGGTYGGGFHGSEVAFWKDAASTMAGVLQGVPMHAPIYLESTPNGAQGYFYERCMEALQGVGVWTLHFYQWWWEDEYRIPLEHGEVLSYTAEESVLVEQHKLSPEQIKWRRFKLLELGDKFLQEYPEDVATCFLRATGGVFRVPSEQFYTPHENTALDKHLYVAGIDWGEDKDFTVCSVFDVTEHREVALYRENHASYAHLCKRIVELCQRYQVEKLIVERNSMGKSAAEHLQNAIESEVWPNHPRTGYPAIPVLQLFNMSNKSKVDLVSYFQDAIQSGMLLLDGTIAKAELADYAKQQTPSNLWNYAAATGHDDTVIARMLANYACYELRS